MNDDDFPNLVRSGTGHSVSVSELTGNAKNPKNMVVSHEEETEARKRAFEQKALAALDAEKALTAALAEHTEHAAPTDDAQDANIQKVTSDKAAVNLQNVAGDDAANPNIQSVNTDVFETNNQKVSTDKIQDNIQTVGNDKGMAANVQNVSADAIASNVQSIGSGNIDANRQSVAGEKAIETNRQDISEQSLGDNNQEIPHDTAGLNRQALSPPGTTQNSASIAPDALVNNAQKIDKSDAQDNKQSLHQGELSKNNQPLAPAAGLTPNNQSVETDATSLNRQAAPQDTLPDLNRQDVDNGKIASHFEQIPTGDVDRKKVKFPTSQDKGRSSALRSKANGARAPLNTAERQQATLNRNHAMDVFHGRLAGIKQNVDALNSRLTDLEEKVHTDEAKLEKGNPKDFKVDGI